MSKNVLITLNAGLGYNLGPNFNLTANVGSVNPSTATKTQLLSGIIATVHNSASIITVASTGTCTNSTTISITEIPTTTTSTTLAP